MAMCPIDSLRNEHDKWVTGSTNTIKIPIQGTTLGEWNVCTLYAFRERVDRNNNTGTLDSYCQQIRLDKVVCFFSTPHPMIEAVKGLMMTMMIYKNLTVNKHC